MQEPVIERFGDRDFLGGAESARAIEVQILDGRGSAGESEEPYIVSTGQPGEQWTMFFTDPSGNLSAKLPNNLTTATLPPSSIGSG